jgi:hypothetical protein
MRWLLPLLAAALLTLGASFSSVGTSGATDPALRPIGIAAPRVRCEHPGTLRLRRFEDRSARLECAGRVLVRVSVPG